MKKMNFQKLKQAMSNPPPERLAKIEYRSHLYQAFGISFVCLMLIYKGMWYIIFAFMFGIGISYSQGMGAYNRYKTIMEIIGPEKMEDYEKDISPSRRRSKIIQSVFKPAKIVSVILSVITTMFIIDPTMSRLKLSLMYPTVILLMFVFYYFFVMYWISYPIYKRRIKK